MNNLSIMEEKKDNQTGKTDGKKFLTIANTIFSPIYPVIASQILANTSIHTGKALDVGTGPGHLATALAEASELEVAALDNSEEMIQICTDRIIEKGLAGRVRTAHGDVCAIPFDDESFDLIVSRGSWFFWEDLPKGLTEIYRVLKPGGKTYIGGGFGTASLKKQIVSAMKEKEPDFENGIKERVLSRSPDIVASALNKACVHNYSIIDDESGFWLMMVRE